MQVFIWIVVLSLIACSNYSSNNKQADKISIENSSATNQQEDTFARDNLSLAMEELTNIYTQAIAEFIKATYQKDNTTFDTLYFGKHIYGQPDDFPDIELPQIIENTQIRLISPELGQKKQAVQKKLVYVNMMGWVDKEKAEFVLVVFSNGGQHQYDYFINFIADNLTKFELDKIEFESYADIIGQKPMRTTIYKDHHYIPDK